MKVLKSIISCEYQPANIITQLGFVRFDFWKNEGCLSRDGKFQLQKYTEIHLCNGGSSADKRRITKKKRSGKEKSCGKVQKQRNCMESRTVDCFVFNG